MLILLGSNVVELDDVAALVAALDGALARDLIRFSSLTLFFTSMDAYGQPVHRVRIGRVSGAAGILLITGAVDNDRVVQSP